MRLPTVLALAVLLAPSLVAETRPDMPVLKDATAVLRVADAQWIDRQVAQFAAACGQDPTPARERMARALFFSSSTAGIDLQRPALIAWRPGHAPLVAIIPIANRRAFVDAFGALPAGEPPLVRTNDREGTVVYTQNRPGGRDEYRLLVSDNTAYLARSTDECRQLASRPLALAEDYAVGFAAWGPFEGALPLGISFELPEALPGVGTPAMRTIASALVDQARQSLPGQVTGLSWQLRSAPNNGALWTASLQLATDSPFAEWLRAQANQGGRLAGALPETMPLRLQGQFAWQGQCDALGHQLAPAMKARSGAAWTPAVEEAWMTTWSMLDHAGGFAVGAKSPGALVAIVEHPQAELLGGQIAAVDAALDGKTADKDAAIPGWRLGADGSAVGIGERQVVVADVADASDATTAQATLARLAAAPPASGVPALIVASFDFTQFVSQTYEERLEPEIQLPRVSAQLVIKAGHDELQAQCELPLADAAGILSKVNWK